MNLSASQLEEIKQCLRDAEVLEERMSQDEMVSLYKAIKSSETTANEEDEKRKLTLSSQKQKEKLKKSSYQFFEDIEDEKPATQNFSLEKEAIKKVPSQKRESYKEHSLENLKSEELNNKMEDCNISELHVEVKTNSSEQEENAEEKDIFNEDKEKLNNNDNGSVCEKKIFIDVLNCKPDLHDPLPLVKHFPRFHPPYYCDASLIKCDENIQRKKIYEYHLLLLQRYQAFQMKANIYAPWGNPIHTNPDFNGSLSREKFNYPVDENANNSNKSSSESLSYENDTMVYVSRTGRQTKRHIYKEVNDEEFKTNKKQKTNNSFNSTSTTTSKKRVSKTNDEIMKRSKLFNDLGVTRAEKLFDSLQEETKKKEQEESKIAKFESSLQVSEDDLFEDNVSSSSTSDLVHKEEPFLKKRIIPPIPGRKNHRKQAIEEVPTSCTSSESDKNEETEEENNQTICPMCNKSFSQSEIEDHAWSCNSSEENDLNGTPTPSKKHKSPKLKKLSCSICDKFFLFNTDYEVHVAECLRKTISSNKR